MGASFQVCVQFPSLLWKSFILMLLPTSLLGYVSSLMQYERLYNWYHIDLRLAFGVDRGLN